MSAVAIGLRTAVLQHVHLGTAHIATVPAAVTCLTSTLSWMDHARLVLETSLPTALLPHVQLGLSPAMKIMMTMSVALDGLHVRPFNALRAHFPTLVHLFSYALAQFATNMVKIVSSAVNALSVRPSIMSSPTPVCHAPLDTRMLQVTMHLLWM